MKYQRLTLAITAVLAIAGSAYFWFSSRKPVAAPVAEADSFQSKSTVKKEGTGLLRHALHEAKVASTAHQAEAVAHEASDL